jgi:hypothetical protein
LSNLFPGSSGNSDSSSGTISGKLTRSKYGQGANRPQAAPVAHLASVA